MSTSITISKQIAIKDEGVLKTSDVNSIDFTGAGITATNVGNAVTVNVPGSAGGGGVHVLLTPISNQQYSSRLNSIGGFSTGSAPSNTIVLYPFIPAKSLTIKNLVINVAGAVVGGLSRVVIYSDLNGVPTTKLLESTSFDASTTGDKTYTVSFTFTAGTTYWLGCYSNLSIPLVIMEYSQCIPISSVSLYQGYPTASIATTFPLAPTTLGSVTLTTTFPTSIILTAL
jgi:hypothetical protein